MLSPPICVEPLSAWQPPCLKFSSRQRNRIDLEKRQYSRRLLRVLNYLWSGVVRKRALASGNGQARVDWVFNVSAAAQRVSSRVPRETPAARVDVSGVDDARRLLLPRSRSVCRLRFGPDAVLHVADLMPRCLTWPHARPPPRMKPSRGVRGQPSSTESRRTPLPKFKRLPTMLALPTRKRCPASVAI